MEGLDPGVGGAMHALNSALSARVAALDARATEVHAREAALRAGEVALGEREAAPRQHEAEVHAREVALYERGTTLDAREAKLEELEELSRKQQEVKLGELQELCSRQQEELRERMGCIKEREALQDKQQELYDRQQKELYERMGRAAEREASLRRDTKVVHAETLRLDRLRAQQHAVPTAHNSAMAMLTLAAAALEETIPAAEETAEEVVRAKKPVPAVRAKKSARARKEMRASKRRRVGHTEEKIDTEFVWWIKKRNNYGGSISYRVKPTPFGVHGFERRFKSEDEAHAYLSALYPYRARDTAVVARESVRYQFLLPQTPVEFAKKMAHTLARDNGVLDMVMSS